ncbi:MAG: VacJ family lipoprotein [Halofilum sp. (in: g-proteobacteria)]
MDQTRPARRLALIALCVLLSGCATAPDRGGEPNDPLEPVNRRVHAFNQVFDRNIAQPVARGYNAVLPRPVNHGISNFFRNLGDVGVLVNSALQLKPRATVITANRLMINTTFGIAGVIDVAGRMGARRQDEDFGQTLGYWGVDAGPYLVLPFLGPSSARDGTGLLVDTAWDPVHAVDDGGVEVGLSVLRIVDTRARLLGTSRLLETAAVDSYSYTRDAWLRRRVNQIYDGDPPPEALPDSGADDGGDDDFDPFSDEDDDLFDNGDGDGG